MRNYVQPGDTVDLTAPAGGVVSGQGYVIGALFVIAAISAAAGAKFSAKVTGVADLPKAASVTPAEGAIAYWNNTAKTVTGTSATGLFPIGVFVAAPAAGDATARVRLSASNTVAV